MEKESKQKSKEADPGSRARRVTQYVAATAACLGALVAGTAIAWTSPALPLLQNVNVTEPLSAEQGSWVGSLLALGAVFGAPPAGYIAQTLGRRTAILSLAGPFIASWVMLLSSTSPVWLYIGRFLAGMGVGGVCVAIPIYVAEIAEDSIRGTLGALLQVMFNLGFLFAYSVGSLENYNILGFTCLLLPILFAASMFFMPESPQYLLTKNRQDEAVRALKWLRDEDHDAVKEIDALRSSVEDKTKDATASFTDLYATIAARKAMTISLSLVAFQQLSGICVVLFYTEFIFKAAGGTLSPSLSAIIVGVVMLIMSYVTAVLVDKAGRRVLLLVSSGVMALSLGVLGLYFLLLQNGYDVSSVTWLPLLSVVVYIIVYCLGLGPLPWTVMAEVLPSDIKGLGGSVVAGFCWALSFVVTKSFQNLVDYFGPYFAFWLFGVACVASTIFVAASVPETKGKSLQEIQDVLSNRKPVQVRNNAV